MEKNTAPVLVRTTWASLGHHWPKEAIKAQVAEDGGTVPVTEVPNVV
jgi:hypothetical protein